MLAVKAMIGFSYPRSFRTRFIGGFTLIELMVTVTIAAILLAVGVPSFKSFILGQRLKTASYDLNYALNYARSEAIKRNESVQMVPASSGWKDGWTVLSGTTTLLTQAAYPALTITGPASSVTYAANGRLTAAATPFHLTDGTNNRCISVNLNGLPTSKVGSCS